MPQLHLFNPENDIMLQWPAQRSAAMAAGHTLGAPVEALRRSGAMLPALWAAPGDAILVDEADVAAARRWLEGISSLLPQLRDVRVVSAAEAPARGAYVGAPWGWSGYAARRLAAHGAQCPDLQRLERMRQLSHRRTSLRVMRQLAATLEAPLPPLPVEAATMAEARSAAAGFGSFYLKAPWSSSGRGVARFEAMTAAAEARAESILRRQGSVMVEKTLDGRQDFAMLFHAEEGRVAWRGYSLFFTSRASYGGNLLLDDAAIEERLVAQGADRTALLALRPALQDALATALGGDYCGWLGVDMLLCRDGMIAPCLEVNLRMTMGIVAHCLAERLLARGASGVYTVAPRGNAHPAPEPIIDGGRMLAGSLELTPPGAFAFTVAADSPAYR